MSKRIAVLAAIGGLTLATAASSQTQPGRIVVVDMNKVFNEYYKTPVASGKLKETAEGFNKEHEEMLADYRKQVDELNKLREEQDKPEYTAEVREQKRKAVNEKLAETQKRQRDIEEYRRSHQKILEDATQRMRASILKEINEVVTKESRDAGYMLVLDKSGNTLNGVPSIVFAQDALEITEDIVKILNKNAPKTTEAPKSESTKPDDKKPAEKKPAEKK
jgi:outer membrane protein